MDGVKGDFKDKLGGHRTNRTIPVYRVIPDPSVKLYQLVVGKSEIGFAHRDKLPGSVVGRTPAPKRVV